MIRIGTDGAGGIMIEIREVSHAFGPIRAVDGVSLTVEPGEVVALLGPNGAGKSTTLRMLCGFLRPERGTVRIGGLDLWSDPLGARRWFGYLPEVAPLYPEMLVEEFLTFVGRARGMDREAIRTAFQRVGQVCHLDRVWMQTIGTLSKGFRRRVGLAQALLHDPDCLILDEPADGLDPNQKRELREVIEAMRADKAILLSTHDLHEVVALDARVVILSEGRVVAEGKAAELAERAENGGGFEGYFAEVTGRQSS